MSSGQRMRARRKAMVCLAVLRMHRRGGPQGRRAALIEVAEKVTTRFLWHPNLRDEGDNFVVEIAVAAQPCTIVTHNVRDFQAGELRFPTVFVKRPQEIVQQGRT